MSISVLIFFLEICLMAIQNSSAINVNGNLQALLFILIFSAGLVYDLENSEVLYPYKSWIIVGYMIRLTMLFIDRFGNSVISLPGSGADTEAFYRQCVEVARGENLNDPGAFVILFGTIFTVIGINRVYGQFIIVLFSLIALIFLAFTLNSINYIDTTNKKIAYGIVCLLPNYAILSSVFLRESIVSMFVTISFYCFIRYIKEKSFIYIAGAVVTVFLSMLFHSGTAGIIVGYIVALLLYDSENDSIHISLKNIFLAMTIGFITAFLYITRGEILFRKFAHIDEITDIASGIGRGNSTYAQYVGSSNSLGNMVRYTPLRILYFLYSPFPWQWRGMQDIVAFALNSLYYIFISVKAFLGINSSQRENRNLTIILLLIILCDTFVFAWGTSNTGTAIRHRDKLITAFALLHVVCMSQTNEKVNTKSKYIR